MERKIEELSPTKRKITVTVDEATWKEELKKAFQKLASKVEIKGFRAGKAPEHLLREHVRQEAIYQEAIDKTSDALTEKIDWTKAWSKKYPILATYQKEVETERYAVELSRLLDDLQKRYGYDELNAMLVLKDILAAVWKSRKNQK